MNITGGGFSFELESNSRYAEILELAKRMDKLKIPYELKPCYDGWELLYPNAENVVMDAVSHILVNESRNLIEIMGPGSHPSVYRKLNAAQAIEYFYVHYRMNRRSVDKLIPPRPIKAEFYDIESQEYLTREQLRREFEEAKANDLKNEQGYKSLTFTQYINNCMTYNNGTLVQLRLS